MIIVSVPIDPADPPRPLGSILIIPASPELVSPVTTAVLSILALDDPTSVSVETSAQLAELRATVGSQLGASSRSLVLGLLGITAALVAALEYGLVMMCRKDFGRRRTLGATRGFIVTLVITQTGLLALAGISLGLAASISALTANRHPLFTGALAILALATSLAASILPAIVASQRDPVNELRIP